MKDSRSYSFEDIQYFRFGYSPFGKPSYYTYIYFVDGLLIDTGQAKMRKEILHLTSELDVNQLFITHHHEDHAGNIEALGEQFNCPVYAPKMCCEIMKNPPPLSPAQRFVWGSRPAYDKLVPKDDQVVTPRYSFKLIPIPGHAKDMVA
tara:strand:- start:2176 stop:2619 length:444 start_codon:yes stop_codon:yes gene_type:complete